ncbi:DUF2948 family protein [Rhodobacteraceae bacterium RKSG542]|uniref:DUF2948 family protein n=1 Tax=Pseudovibrio flavus TaxID=2529854 RepID=UPI0012BBFF32|nr:DUF2948 family protein [Pseudovibrio flavus]MTI18847.1 DUF2948 family protein [Pseudovibrio flavus]
MKLAALDEEDLTVVSTMVQDAVLKVGDIQYFPKEKQLVVAMNRFAWDEAESAPDTNQRHRAVLRISRIESLQCKNIDQANKDTVLSLLALRFQPEIEPGGRLILEFSGGAAMAANVECLEVQLADLGARWATSNRPHHELD